MILRIDWGYLYIAAEPIPLRVKTVGSGPSCRQAFIQNGSLPQTLDAASSALLMMTCLWRPRLLISAPFGNAGTKPRVLILAYDDSLLHSILQKQFKALLAAATAGRPRSAASCGRAITIR